jgi:hypothetical protein
MPVANILADFQSSAAQSIALASNAHNVDGSGAYVHPEMDRKQITVAAFLNLHIAWETFLEEALSCFMTGDVTLGGSAPIKYVSPQSRDLAKKMVIGTMTYFDYGNHHRVRTIANLYFKDGYPFEAVFASLFTDLGDIRTFRNASAHISSSTQRSLDAAASRIFSTPMQNVELYNFLTMTDPRSSGGTIFVTCKDKLALAADMIAKG